MKTYIIKTMSILAILVFVVASWGTNGGGSHTSLDGKLISEWESYDLYGYFECFNINREYDQDKYSGSPGKYVEVYSYFTYYDEPYVFTVSSNGLTQTHYTIYIDSIVFGVTTNILAILVFVGVIRIIQSATGNSKYSRKFWIKYLILCFVLIALSAWQLHRINNPKWREEDEIKQEENYIEWEQAKTIILSGNVVSIFQAHSKVVSIILKDGESYVSLEPSIDDIYDVVDQCGAKCSEVVLLTE